jgi:hypothetical protein
MHSVNVCTPNGLEPSSLASLVVVTACIDQWSGSCLIGVLLACRHVANNRTGTERHGMFLGLGPRVLAEVGLLQHYNSYYEHEVVMVLQCVRVW